MRAVRREETETADRRFISKKSSREESYSNRNTKRPFLSRARRPHAGTGRGHARACTDTRVHIYTGARARAALREVVSIWQNCESSRPIGSREKDRQVEMFQLRTGKWTFLGALLSKKIDGWFLRHSVCLTELRRILIDFEASIIKLQLSSTEIFEGTRHLK